MRLFPFVLLSSIVIVGCVSHDDEAEPREVCGNGTDDDADRFVDEADQDCWDADAGPPPVADSGPAPPAVDAGIPPPPPPSGCGIGLTRIRFEWTSEAETAYTHIQGCWGARTVTGRMVCEGPSDTLERLEGMDGTCMSDTPLVVCRVDRVPVGTPFDFNPYRRDLDGSERWGVEGDPAMPTERGVLSVREDRDCDGRFETERTGDVRVVGLGNGDYGANYTLTP